MTFTVEYRGKKYQLNAERINSFPKFETWRVEANNKSFFLECNQPDMLRLKLDHYPWSWRIISGCCPKDFEHAMQNALEKAIRASSPIYRRR